MRLKLLTCLALCALAALLPATALARSHKSKSKPATTYYLALGDSLSRGVQPNAAGTSVPTNHGYANFIYAKMKKQIKGLKLEQLGCPGETTTSMLNGGTFCKYSAGSQIKAAMKFIAAHKGKIAFITLDIGANDIDNCVSSTGAIDTACIATGTNSIEANVPMIAKDLRDAAGSKVKIAGMTYYDPFLASYLLGATGQATATESVLLAKSINGTLATDFAAQKFKVADVATAFDVYAPFTMTVPTSVGPEPVAVAQTCALTYMCTLPPVGPNIHATTAGYQEIAKVFLAVL
jgi:lysophospholipase L1-like esterase